MVSIAALVFGCRLHPSPMHTFEFEQCCVSSKGLELSWWGLVCCWLLVPSGRITEHSFFYPPPSFSASSDPLRPSGLQHFKDCSSTHLYHLPKKRGEKQPDEQGTPSYSLPSTRVTMAKSKPSAAVVGTNPNVQPVSSGQSGTKKRRRPAADNDSFTTETPASSAQVSPELQPNRRPLAASSDGSKKVPAPHSHEPQPASAHITSDASTAVAQFGNEGGDSLAARSVPEPLTDNQRKQTVSFANGTKEASAHRVLNGTTRTRTALPTARQVPVRREFVYIKINGKTVRCEGPRIRLGVLTRGIPAILTRGSDVLLPDEYDMVTIEPGDNLKLRLISVNEFLDFGPVPKKPTNGVPQVVIKDERREDAKGTATEQPKRTRLTGYLLFVKSLAGSGTPFKEIGQKWKALGDEDRKKFNDEAKRIKDEPASNTQAQSAPTALQDASRPNQEAPPADADEPWRSSLTRESNSVDRSHLLDVDSVDNDHDKTLDDAVLEDVNPVYDNSQERTAATERAERIAAAKKKKGKATSDEGPVAADSAGKRRKSTRDKNTTGEKAAQKRR